MKVVATIGFGKKSAEQFVGLLNGAKVTTVIDTRRRADSPLSGYARKRDLPFLLRSSGIGYEHCLELAPPDDLLMRYREDKDWESYVDEFNRRVLANPEAAAAMNQLANRPETIALLCSEPTPEQCHRRLVAERMAEANGPLTIRHLV